MIRGTLTVALLAALAVQTQGFTQVVTATANTVATAAADPDATARKNWRELIAKSPVPTQGCSHVSYPNYVWESVACKVVPPHVQPVRASSLGQAPASVGNGHDYIAQSQGLISYAAGEFQVTGITSETGVSVNDGGGILGQNEYMLQINTNNDRTTSACADHFGCTVWQQFMYATDYDDNNTKSAVFIQYWLFEWNAVCPSGWWPSDGASHEDCYRNSSHTEVPHLPVTELGNIAFTASATPGGDDVVTLIDGGDAYVVTANDDVLDIGSVWYQAEFNVVGDTNRSEAVFNSGSSINAVLQLADGSVSPPSCIEGIGTTGETNNLNLGTCQAFVFLGPAIAFTESLPNARIWPPLFLTRPPVSLALSAN